mmetsp:Transcript_27535/g.58922  ORF Transcript_27535/g.58922 Transcript_27535/m.58922 type:complete len:222 (+) Transcript_27535:196-861(+)
MKSFIAYHRHDLVSCRSTIQSGTRWWSVRSRCRCRRGCRGSHASQQLVIQRCHDQFGTELIPRGLCHDRFPSPKELYRYLELLVHECLRTILQESLELLEGEHQDHLFFQVLRWLDTASSLRLVFTGVTNVVHLHQIVVAHAGLGFQGSVLPPAVQPRRRLVGQVVVREGNAGDQPVFLVDENGNLDRSLEGFQHRRQHARLDHQLRRPLRRRDGRHPLRI